MARVIPALSLSAILFLLTGWLGNSGAADIDGSNRNASDQGDFLSQEKRGRFLALTADCASCHTAEGGAAYSGGRPVDTPFGVVYSRNLTPDPETGLGRWSNAEFYRVLHEGLTGEGSHLYPTLPYIFFTSINKDDANAIKAFLDTLTPIRNVVPASRSHWPPNHRLSMAIWNVLFFHEGTSKHKGGIISPGDERRQYLLAVLSHCGACHTSKKFLGAN